MPIGNFSVYITSYIHINQEFVTMHYGTYFGVILTFSMTFSRSLGGMLETKLGFMTTTLFGLILIIICNIFFFKVQNIYVCYVLIVIMGIGAGIATSLVQKNLTFYNPKKKGRISGLLGMLMIVSGAIFGFIGEKIINRDGAPVNKEQVYEKDVAERTYIYYLSGFIITPVGTFLAYLFLYEYKKEEDPNYKSEQNNLMQKELAEIDDVSSNPNEELIADLDPKKEEEREKIRANKNFEREVNRIRQKKHISQVTKSARFWRISIASLLLNFPIMFMINTGRIIGAIVGINGQALQIMPLFQAVGIVIFGPILGYISDKTNPLILLRIVTLVCIFPGIILNLYLDNTYTFLSSVIIDVVGFIGYLVGSPPLTMEIFGIQESVILGSFISTFSKISDIVTAITAFFVSFIYQGNRIVIPYKIIYILGSFFSYISFFLLMIEDIDKYKYDDSDVDISSAEISRENFLSIL